MIHPPDDSSPEALRPFADHRLRFLAEVARSLGDVVSYADTCELCAGLAVPRLADVSVLALGDRTAGDGTGRIIVRHRLQTDEARAEGLIRDALPLLTDVGQRVARLRSAARGLWLPAISERSLRRVGGPPAAELVRLAGALGIESLIAIPLANGSQPTGVLALGRLVGEERYHAGDFAAARALGIRMAAALDRSRLREHLALEDARRARAEDALVKWTHAFEHAPYGAAIVAPGGRLESVNLAFARMHGYSTAAELRGVGLARLREHGAGWPAAVTGGLVWEGVQRRADGTTFPALLSDSPLRSAEGHLLYRAVTVQDLTLLRRAEEQLRHADRMQAIGRLAGGVAHEVNNMMMVVLGFADLLAQAPELTPEHRDDIRYVMDAAERASTISRQLLAYGRQQVLHPAPVDLNRLVQRVTAMVQPLLAGRITVRLEPGDLGGRGVFADAGQLEQALLNLALNARDAMPAGGELRIATTLGRVPPDVATYHLGFELPPVLHVLLTVADCGVGMDAKTLAHAFDPFFTTKPVGQGTGLGLATVYGIVKQSGGYIWAESDPGRGTSFTVCLRAVQLEAYGAQRPGASLLPAGRAQILVVDDEPAIRQLTTRMLERLGYETVAASGGSEALQLIETGGPDLVLADVMMPVISGPQLRERIVATRPDLPVILMSGHPSIESLRNEPGGGDTVWLEKPFTISVLAETIRGALSVRVPEA